MTLSASAGQRLWEALESERPLQVVGTINAYSALLAERAGFRAIYLSGAGVANASFGLLGRHVVGGAQHGAGESCLVGLVQKLRHSEISNLGLKRQLGAVYR